MSTPKEIPALTEADALTGSEQFHVVQGGNSRRVTLGEFAGLVPEGPEGPEGPQGQQGPKGD